LREFLSSGIHYSLFGILAVLNLTQN